MLTHRNLVANVLQIEAPIEITPNDRILAVLPFFHIYGMTVLLNAALYNRASLVTMPKFELPEFLRIVAEQRCTYVFVAPPVAVALAKHPLVEQFDLSSVHTVFSGAAPLDRALGEAVSARLHCKVRQGYGMSEMSPVSHVIPFDGDDVPLDSVGPTLAGMECKLVDPNTGRKSTTPSERATPNPANCGARDPTSCSATSATRRPPPTRSTRTATCTPETSRPSTQPATSRSSTA